MVTNARPMLILFVASCCLLAGCFGPGTSSESPYGIVAEDFDDTAIPTGSELRTVEEVPAPVHRAINGTRNSTRLRNKSGVSVSESEFRTALGAFYDGTVPADLASEYEYYIVYQGDRYRITFVVERD